VNRLSFELGSLLCVSVVALTVVAGVMSRPAAGEATTEVIEPADPLPWSDAPADLAGRWLLDADERGARVLVLAHRGPHQTLEVIDPDGTTHRLEDAAPGVFAGPQAVLSESGRFVLGATALDGAMILYRWDVDGGVWAEVARFSDAPPWGGWPAPLHLSNDGTTAVYLTQTLDGEAEVVRHDLADLDSEVVQLRVGTPSPSAVVVAGGGRHLLYRVDDGAGAVFARHDLVTGEELVVDAVRGEVAERPGHMAISPNGRYVAFLSRWYDVESGERSLLLGRWWGEALFVEMRPHGQASLSNRGELLFLTADALDPADRNGASDFYLWSPTGTTRRVTDTPSSHVASVAAVVTADGSAAIVEVRGRASQVPALHRVKLSHRADASERHRLVGLDGSVRFIL